jgi:hypothetical protein
MSGCVANVRDYADPEQRCLGRERQPAFLAVSLECVD